MNRTTCHLLAATGLASLMLSTTSTPAAAAQLPEGTVVYVRLLSPITSETAKAGDRIHFVVTRDVIAGGDVVIARRTPAEGAIVAARRASWGFIWHRARLAFTYIQTTGVDGQPIRLRAQSVDNRVNINRSDYHHGLQWATEGDPLEAYVVGNYDFRSQ
jgi:hypothetical protein